MGVLNCIECIAFADSNSSDSLAKKLSKASSILDGLSVKTGIEVGLFSHGNGRSEEQYSIKKIVEKLTECGNQAQSFTSRRISIHIGINEIENIRFNFLFPDPIQNHSWTENNLWLVKARPIIRNGIKMGVFDIMHDDGYFGRSCALYIWLKIKQLYGPSAVIHSSSQGGKAALRNFSLVHKYFSEVIENKVGENAQISESAIQQYVKDCDEIVSCEFTKQEIKNLLSDAQISTFKWFKKSLLF